MGIGPEGEDGEPASLVMPLERYVLAPFSKVEKEGLSKFLMEASQACLVWLQEPPEKTMNLVNSSSIE
jgi:peptidyl-tRNA hydrolase